MILTLFSILNDSMILSQDGVGAAGHKTGSVASAAPTMLLHWEMLMGRGTQRQELLRCGEGGLAFRAESKVSSCETYQ